MKQTAVEWLEEKLSKSSSDELVYNINLWFEQAKQMEKEQGYSKEDMQTAWDSSEQNMRFTFSSSAHKNITFKQWIKAFKNK